MTTTDALFGPELKPWESALDARLSPSSYAAAAVFGLVELAVEEVHRRDLMLTPTVVGQYSQTFARIVIKAQLEYGSGGGWNSMLNTRLRGALRTALTVVDRDQQHTEWEAELQARVNGIAKTAAWLYSRTPRQIGALE
jgi:hypothetical protein